VVFEPRLDEILLLPCPPGAALFGRTGAREEGRPWLNLVTACREVLFANLLFFSVADDRDVASLEPLTDDRFDGVAEAGRALAGVCDSGQELVVEGWDAQVSLAFSKDALKAVAIG